MNQQCKQPRLSTMLLMAFSLTVLLQACATSKQPTDRSQKAMLDPGASDQPARQNASAGGYESPATLKASKLLPPDLLTGPDYKIEESVHNDGYLNIYTITTRFGTFRIVSNALVKKRIGEIHAISAMEKMSASEEFGEGVAEKGKDVLVGAKNLVTAPVDTLSHAGSGVKKLFGRVSENLVGPSRSDAEDSRVESVIGFSKTKRDYAYQLKVDVYSRNKPFQEHLDNLTWAGYSGNMVAALALSFVSAPVLSVSGATNLMDKVFRDKAPADLRVMNRERLNAMGVNQQIAGLFLENGIYTPREQTLLVAALDKMTGTKERAEFIRFATLTGNEDVALFRTRQALMYAAYHRSVTPIKRFVPVGRIAAAINQKGTLVFNVPLDHLVWTEEMARMIGAINQQVERFPEVKRKELWLTGSLTPLARRSLAKLGWHIYDNREKQLGAALK